MSQRQGQRRRTEGVGAGVAILGVVIPVLIPLGQAIGVHLSGDQLRGLFVIAAAVFVLGILIVLYGIGVFRHLRSPIILRSPLRPSEDAPPTGATATDTSVNWPMEYRKQEHENTMLHNELMDWGNDKVARRMLKRARAEFATLSVGFVNDVAGLLYAAYQKPRTNFEVEFKERDRPENSPEPDDGKYGYIGLPDIKRSITLPYAEAALVAGQFRKVIEDVQNESINDAKRPSP